MGYVGFPLRLSGSINPIEMRVTTRTNYVHGEFTKSLHSVKRPGCTTDVIPIKAINRLDVQCSRGSGAVIGALPNELRSLVFYANDFTQIQLCHFSL